jgi:spore coat polysaccharide biosynthesis protein SpsF
LVTAGVAVIPPLVIVQARMGSTRLPRKMLLPLGGKPLVCHATETAIQTFGAEHVKATVPASVENDPLATVLLSLGIDVIRSTRSERDVLGRFVDVARKYRWRPESTLLRLTPDDPWKTPEAMRRVVAGERLPAELGGEAFTLGMLEAAHERETHPHRREHLSFALFDSLPPSPPPGCWTIDTLADYEAACAMAERAA